jgi:ribosomal protein S27AE
MVAAYRVMNKAGHEALAKTHESMIREIREGHTAGSSTIMRFCPQCRARGTKVIMLEMGGVLQCGTCYYIPPDRRK